MADNINVTEGLNRAIATNDVGGINYQIVKIGFSSSGVAPTQVSNTNPLPVTTIPQTPSTSQYSIAAINVAANGANAVIAGTGGQTIRVHGFWFTLASATTVKIGDSTPTDMSGVSSFTAGGGLALDPIGDPRYVCADGKDFRFTLGAAVQCSGTVWYKKS
jgi:hypothetical protein